MAAGPAGAFSSEAADNPLVERFGGWSGMLVSLGERLQFLNGSTEEEFLAIGARLHDFYARAGEIERTSRRVTDLILGEEIGRDMGALQEILDRIADYLSHAERETEESTRTLDTILGFIDHVDDSLDGFRKIIKNLHMLSTAVKIESARLGEGAAGFTTLADDVERLSVSIKEKSADIIGEKETLARMIGETLSRVTTLEAEQRANARLILDRTRHSIATLTGIHGRCSAAAALVSSHSAEVAEGIGEVVTSLQFHDITRQQIEHVSEAMDELCALLGDRSADPSSTAAEVADVCGLQVAQLSHARDELVTAVERIVDNLRAIARKETRMSDETREMAGTADGAGDSFFAEMERDMGRVAEVLSENAAANHNLVSAMGSVVASVRDIADFVTAIEEIGSEIELIALNSQVKAANTGEGGAALGVLAEAIQHLSVEARARTGAVSDTLRKVTEVTESLSSGFDATAGTIATEVNSLIAELKGLLSSVRGVNGQLLSLLGSMDGEVQALSRDIDGATSTVGVHQTVAGVIGEAIAGLDEVVREVRPLVPAAAAGVQERRLRELVERYTMHSERKVHETIVGRGSAKRAGAASAGFATPAAVAASDDGFGDNVELF